MQNDEDFDKSGGINESHVFNNSSPKKINMRSSPMSVEALKRSISGLNINNNDSFKIQSNTENKEIKHSETFTNNPSIQNVNQDQTHQISSSNFISPPKNMFQNTNQPPPLPATKHPSLPPKKNFSSNPKKLPPVVPKKNTPSPPLPQIPFNKNIPLSPLPQTPLNKNIPLPPLPQIPLNKNIPLPKTPLNKNDTLPQSTLPQTSLNKNLPSPQTNSLTNFSANRFPPKKEAPLPFDKSIEKAPLSLFKRPLPPLDNSIVTTQNLIWKQSDLSNTSQKNKFNSKEQNQQQENQQEKENQTIENQQQENEQKENQNTSFDNNEINLEEISQPIENNQQSNSLISSNNEDDKKLNENYQSISNDSNDSNDQNKNDLNFYTPIISPRLNENTQEAIIPINLEPLSSKLHPKRSPPQLHPTNENNNNNFVESHILVSDNSDPIQKKKKHFFGNKKKVENDNEVKENTIMSGFKKMTKKIGFSNKVSKVSNNPIISTMVPERDPKEDNTNPSDISPLHHKLQAYSNLIELLCEKDLFLLQKIANIVKRGDVDKQSRSWTHLLIPKGCMVNLIGKIIFTEVQKTEQEGTLFRNNTFSVSLMSIFSHQIGDAYLKNILHPLLLDVLNAGSVFEINPESGLDEDTIDHNTINLIQICESYVDTIINSKLKIPSDIIRICHLLKQSVYPKFPSAINTCIGGFFFLRFLTPAIVSPEGFGIIDQENPLSIESRRPLILISKTLQQISNEMFFSEEYMMSINTFISDNIIKFQQLFEFLSNVEEEYESNYNTIQYDSKKNKIRDESLIRIHQFLINSLPEIKQIILPDDPNYQLLLNLEHNLNDLGEPPDIKILKESNVPIEVNSLESQKGKNNKMK